MPTIKPFRQYNEANVINGLFTVSGANVSRGTFVVAQGSGYNTDAELTLGNLSQFEGTYSSKFNIPATVVPAPSGATQGQIVGMLIYDHKTVDENGYPLIYNRRKAAEMEVTTSGEAAPLLRKGYVLYSGIVGTPSIGSGAAISDAGNGELKVVPFANRTVGKFLGPKNSEGFALLEVDL